MTCYRQRVLLVGDPHVVPEELEDCHNLLGLVVDTAHKYEVNTTLFLGDQHHSHGSVSAEVIWFWRQHLQDLVWTMRDQDGQVVMLRGNHDHHPNNPHYHALLAYRDMAGVQVADEGGISCLPNNENVLLVSYEEKPESFLRICQGESAPTVICHQTFLDTFFENGQLCKEGVDSNLLPQNLVISGHIHASQRVGKIWHPGAPRWRSLNDARQQERYIYVVDFAPDGSVDVVAEVPTSSVCRRVISVEDLEEAPLDPQQLRLEKDDVRVLVKGGAAWVNERLPYWKKLGAKPRGVKTDRLRARVKESVGIDQAFALFVEQFKAPHGTPTDQLQELVQERFRGR